jgi:hypothetical protein
MTLTPGSDGKTDGEKARPRQSEIGLSLAIRIRWISALKTTELWICRGAFLFDGVG